MDYFLKVKFIKLTLRLSILKKYFGGCLQDPSIMIQINTATAGKGCLSAVLTVAHLEYLRLKLLSDMKTVVFSLHWTSLVTTEQKSGSPTFCPGGVWASSKLLLALDWEWGNSPAKLMFRTDMLTPMSLKTHYFWILNWHIMTGHVCVKCETAHTNTLYNNQIRVASILCCVRGLPAPLSCFLRCI